MVTRKEINVECPSCDKKMLTQVIAYRKSFTPKSVKYFCEYLIKIGKNAFEKCGFKAHIKLNKGQYDYIGEVKPY